MGLAPIDTTIATLVWRHAQRLKSPAARISHPPPRAADAIRKKTISSLESTKLSFERIRQFKPRLKAIVAQLESEAMK
jgi:hypothetical protein